MAVVASWHRWHVVLHILVEGVQVTDLSPLVAVDVDVDVDVGADADAEVVLPEGQRPPRPSLAARKPGGILEG